MQVPNSERLLPDNTPDTRQFEHLSAKFVLFAQRHDTLSISINEDSRIKRYKVPPLTHFERPDVLEGAPFGYLYQRSIGAIVSQIAFRQWSLRIISTTQVTDLGSDRGGMRSTYIFDWDKDRVTQSRRKIAVIPEDDPPEMEELMDNFPTQTIDTPMFALRDGLEMMSSADVSLLTRDIDATLSQVDNQERPYRELRKNYLDYFAK